MADIPMDEKQINDLAMEITKTYMANKAMLNSKDFINTFLDFHKLAKDTIKKREREEYYTVDDTKLMFK